MVICLERGADLHMSQLMPLPLTVSCFSKIQIGFTFLVLAHPGSPGQGRLNAHVCVFLMQINNNNNNTIIPTPFFSGGRLLAMNKKSGSIRPIAVGVTL